MYATDSCPLDGAGPAGPLGLGASPETDRQLLALVAAAGPDADWARVSRVERVGALAVLDHAVTVPVRVPEPVAVGDWCVVRPAGERRASGAAVYDVVSVVPRRTQLIRRAAGPVVTPQVLAVNVDAVLIALPLDRDVSRRALERLCAIVWESGAEPVVLLTKADVVAPAVLAAAVETVSPVCPAVLALSVPDARGLDELRAVVLGRTSVLLGGSGAGKSTLVNALTDALVSTGEVRAVDGKGRHTTTWRELVALPGGGALIDTPGVRELGLWMGTDGVSAAFADLAELAAGCRFADCGHGGEPGCAVAEALESGALDPDRLASFRKLEREAAYVARQNDRRLAAQELQKWKRRSTDARRHRGRGY